MIAVCVNSRPDRLPEPLLIRSGEILLTQQPIEGREYTVDAMALTFYGIRLLMDTLDNLRPKWFPIERFGIVDSRIPPHWKFRNNQGKFLVFAIWGYKSLIDDQHHYEELAYGRHPALDDYERDRGPRFHLRYKENGLDS